MKLLRPLAIATLAAQAVALSIGGRQMVVERESDGLQNIVSSLTGASGGEHGVEQGWFKKLDR
jgi:hypothetical protein